MVQKRPFVEKLYDVSPKHPRLEHNGQLVSCLEFPSQDVFQEPYYSGEAEGCFAKHITESDNKLESGKITDLLMCTEKDVENIFPVRNSTTSWASSTTTEEDMWSEATTHIMYPTEHYSPLRPRRIRPEDTYSYFLGNSPPKLVPIGPDFQVNIPEWCGNCTKNGSICSVSAEASIQSPRASESNFMSSVEDKTKLVGSCVIPMPEEDSSSCHGDGAGSGRTECCCEIPGSVVCVQQHIREARENLTKTIGLEGFLELGFGNMGEVVAEKWSEEEQQLFHEVVYSNPASLGKNFWDYLAVVFPSRTNEEIVSYYFNVFMLRTRAEQNRCDPINIDSDNDEWQGSDELEEDDDSCTNEIHDEGIENRTCDDYENVDFHSFNGNANYSFNSTSQPSEKTLADENDSCTSSDTGAARQVCQVKVDDNKTWGSHEFVLEPCDAKVWDVGYLTCPRNEVDFLPTCSMIEEVFGVGAWN